MHTYMQNYSPIRNTIGFWINKKTNLKRSHKAICSIVPSWKTFPGMYNIYLYREALEEKYTNM